MKGIDKIVLIDDERHLFPMKIRFDDEIFSADQNEKRNSVKRMTMGFSSCSSTVDVRFDRNLLPIRLERSDDLNPVENDWWRKSPSLFICSSSLSNR